MAVREYFLAPLTARIPLRERINLAQEAGYSGTSLTLEEATQHRIGVPYSQRHKDALVDLIAICNSSKILNVGLGRIWHDDDVRRARSVLDIGHQCGVKYAQLVIMRSNWSWAINALRNICDTAISYHICLCIEFMEYSTIKTYDDAIELVKAINRENCRICFDIFHFIRGGGTVEHLDGRDNDIVSYIQLSDGPLLKPRNSAELEREALTNRLVPGKGEFALSEIIHRFDSKTPIELEVPTSRMPTEERLSYVSTLLRSGKAIATSGKLIGKI